MNIITIIGARPQFIKAAALSKALIEFGVNEKIVHTGQHYDYTMSELFFKQLEIPPPAKFLNLGAKSHAKMTGDMLSAIEDILIIDKPDAVMVYGDTNSTLSGALAAAKLNIPVIHVEAGLRSWNRDMPEEINRVLTDHISTLLFCSSEVGVKNLANEGISQNVELCGDVMADAALTVRKLLNEPSFARKIRLSLPTLPSNYYLMTLHRAENTDNIDRMKSIIEGISYSPLPILLPLHPRTSKMMMAYKLMFPSCVQILDPVGYFEMCYLLENCTKVLTDSGGLQKEAYWYGKFSITLRDETEWVETVETGWNVLVGAKSSLIKEFMFDSKRLNDRIPLYGDGNASVKIVNRILNFFRALPETQKTNINQCFFRDIC